VVEHVSTGTSTSAVSRRFVAATEHALAELLAADLAGLDLVAIMLDGIGIGIGIGIGEHACVVALGITLDGTQGPARPGRGRDRERHRGARAAGVLA
jgi:putative transposase